jgi:sporulation protein YlmC with PRC-barrel domain
MRLTSLVRRPVLGPDGVRLGRVADVLVSLEAAYPEATALLVRRGRAVSRAPWSSVAALGPLA